jgi:hypothetical protein
MPIHESDPAPIISREAATRAAERTVSQAFATDFSVDAVLGPELSRFYSVTASIVQRHGPLIQRTLAGTLAATGRFEVFAEMPIAIPVAADDLLASRNSKSDLAKIKLRAESTATRTVVVDLVVVDREIGWAGGYDIKRGGGMTESRRRRAVEDDLRAVHFVLGSHLAKSGFDIGSVTTAVIDYFGCSGFGPDIKVTRDELNGHFGIDVVKPIDDMTAALRQALRARLQPLIEPALATLPKVVDAALDDATVAQNVTPIIRARPQGPASLRAARKMPA